ncbi:hypothetical protein CBR_g38786 [Chara braunii]|uniref:Uncharacterized protein n=1 Tax=Chara braunii TaxID=69332 RepID=A0A388LQA7_CHABU|nr:hypothetical protein CBR_g38786 [Chara braunii]|eukprot:GBG84504.1 hypothetical protein CBR_g38786 [Chara braunii]
MEVGGELQRRTDDWLVTLEQGCRRLQVMVGELSSWSNEELEDEGGAISLAVWLKNMADDMLDIIWGLEEGPDPQLEACIDWKRAEAMMSTCYALFAEGRNLHYKLEDRLKGEDDLDGEDWQEDGAQEDEVNSSVSINNNNNNINNNDNINNNNDNNNNNINNNGYSDNNNDDNIIMNNKNVNNNTYNGSDEHGSSGVGNGARAYLIIVSKMGEMLHVDAVEFGADNNNGEGGKRRLWRQGSP